MRSTTSVPAWFVSVGRNNVRRRQHRAKETRRSTGPSLFTGFLIFKENRRGTTTSLGKLPEKHNAAGESSVLLGTLRRSRRVRVSPKEKQVYAESSRENMRMEHSDIIIYNFTVYNDTFNNVSYRKLHMSEIAQEPKRLIISKLISN